MTTCKACGAAKPDDRYKACPDCRLAWRLAVRNPNGPKARLERLERAARAVLNSPMAAPYRRLSPFRELARELER